jgi:hypothetical protein
MSHARRIHLCVLIDALGWRFLEGQAFLSDLLPYRTPVRTVLGFSSGAIPTILTGSPFRWFRHFAFMPEWALEHRVTRKLLKEMGRHFLGLGPLFECCVSPRLLPWFNWVEKRNIYDRGGITGSACIFDQLAESGIPYRVYSYHHWTDEEIFARAKGDLQAAEATFFFLYLSELDHFLHDHWGEESLLKGRLAWYARGLRELFHLARELDPRARLTIFSDHGMTPVRHHYDLIKDVEGLGFAMPRDYLAVYDSTMGRFWFFSDQARCQTVERLKSLPCGRIVSDEELKQLGIFFSDRRYGEVIFLLHPGWLMTRSNFNGHQWMPRGMHGYHPGDPYSDAVFLCDREPATNVRTIVDVHAYLQETMGREQ